MPSLPCVLLVDDAPTANFPNRKLLLRLDVAEAVRVARIGQEALTELRACQDHRATCSALLFLEVNMLVLGGTGFLESYQLPPPAQRPSAVVTPQPAPATSSARPACLWQPFLRSPAPSSRWSRYWRGILRSPTVTRCGWRWQDCPG